MDDEKWRGSGEYSGVESAMGQSKLIVKGGKEMLVSGRKGAAGDHL